MKHKVALAFLVIGHSSIMLGMAHGAAQPPDKMNAGTFNQAKEYREKHNPLIVQELHRLYNANPDLDCDQIINESKRYTYLIATAQSGDIPLLKKALAKTKAIDAQDADGFTALNHAAVSDSAEAVQLVLDAGARTDHRDAITHLTPLQLVLGSGQWEVALVFIKAGIQVPEGTKVRYSIVGTPIDPGTQAQPPQEAPHGQEIKELCEKIATAQVDHRKTQRKSLVAKASALRKAQKELLAASAKESEEFDTTAELTAQELRAFDDSPAFSTQILAKPTSKATIKPKDGKVCHWYIGSLKMTQKNKKLMKFFGPMMQMDLLSGIE